MSASSRVSSWIRENRKNLMIAGGVLLASSLAGLAISRAKAAQYQRPVTGVNCDWGGYMTDWYMGHMAYNLLLRPSDLAQFNVQSVMRTEAFTSISPRYPYTEQLYMNFPDAQWQVILGQVGMTDYVGCTPDFVTNFCSWTLQDWDSYVREFVSTHPQIHTWEIWSEPINSSNKWTGFLRDQGLAGYVQMANHANGIIKSQSGHQNDTVIGAGVVPFDISNQAVQNYNNGNFTSNGSYSNVAHVMNLGLGDYIDAWSVHPYTVSAANSYKGPLMSETFTSTGGIQCNLTAGEVMGGLVGAMQSIVGKPLHFNEFGMPVDGTSNQFNSLERAGQYAAETIQLGAQLGAQTALWWTMCQPVWGLWDPLTTNPSPRLPILQAFI